MVSFVEDTGPEDDGRDQKPAADEIPDDKLVKVAIKIRDRIAEITREHEAQVAVLKEQQTSVTNEIIKRLHTRGATQTKTPNGTAFLGEKMTATIADAAMFKGFCLTEQDLDFYQARVKIDHLKEWMEKHEGRLPPGVNIFREVTLNLRAK
jgi:hypothetical protein